MLPGPLRRRVGIRAGDSLDVSVESGQIVLIPSNRRPYKVKIVNDTVTGFPVLTSDAKAPQLTSKEVEEILASFP